jgi:hypothetical protein
MPAPKIPFIRADFLSTAEAAIVAGLPKVTVPLDPKRAARVLRAHFTPRNAQAPGGGVGGGALDERSEPVTAYLSADRTT